MRLTCIAHQKIASIENEVAFGEGLDPYGVWDVPIEFALEHAWDSDVHFVQYELVTVEGIDVRLAKDCIDEIRPVMHVLIGDVDAPGHVRTPEWTAAIEPVLDACPFTYYRTRNGYRLIAPLAEKFTIDSPAKAAEWAARYHGWIDEVARDWKIEIDDKCADWTRLMRAPNVIRDGARETSAVRWADHRQVLPAPKPGAAKVARKSRAQTATSDAMDRARVIAANMPPSIDKHGGDAAIFAAAREIATVLADAAQIETVLADTFNPRCIPPWDDAKLHYEAGRAADKRGRLDNIRRALHKPAPGNAAEDSDDSEIADDEPTGDPLEVASNGKPIASLTNASRMLEMWIGRGLWRDETNGRIMCDGFGDLPKGPWSDEHNTQFRIDCEQFELRIGKSLTQEAVDNHARRHTRNPIREELTRLAKSWDGHSRVDTALERYWGCESTPAVRAASRVFHLSMAARGLEPGCQVDTVLILCGKQGNRKGAYVQILAGDRTRANTSKIDIKNEVKRAMAVRGKWIVELAELAALRKKEDLEDIKGYITQMYDDYRSPYDHYDRQWLRTNVFVGTTNDYEILRDPTGERRWMPVVCVKLAEPELRRDRDQLLAESAARVLAGEQYHPTPAEEIVLADNAENHKETGDPWDDAIETWLARKPDNNDLVTIASITASNGAIPLTTEKCDRGTSLRISSSLARLGFTRVGRKRVGTHVAHAWSRPRPPPADIAPEAPRAGAGAPN